MYTRENLLAKFLDPRSCQDAQGNMNRGILEKSVTNFAKILLTYNSFKNNKHSKQRVGKESIRAIKQKKKLTCFLKKSEFSNFTEKQMSLKLFEFLEQLMIGTFLR